MQFQMETAGFKKKLQKNYKGIQTAGKKFLKPAVNVAALFIGMAVGSTTENHQDAQVTRNF